MPIEYKALKDLDQRCMKVYKVALEAIEKKNFAYAADLFRDILRRVPGAIEVRQKLREAQFMNCGGQVRVWHQQLALLRVLPLKAKIAMHVGKQEFVEALDLAERAMTFDPTAPIAITMVVDVAEAAEAYAIVVEVLEWGMKFHDKNVDFLRRLALAYMAVDRGQLAIECASKLVSLQPTNADFLELRKRALAKGAMDGGGWTDVAKQGEGADFRRLIKDKEEASRLEQSGRTKRTQEGTESLLEKQVVLCQEQPTVQNYTALAELYAEANDLEKALEAYDKVIELAGMVDPGIAQAKLELQLKQYDRAATEWDAYAANPAVSDEERAKARDQAATLRDQKRTLELDSLQARVRRNPTAHDTRFELAKRLLEAGQMDEALTHFQYNQKSAYYRIEATVYVARCFLAKNLCDMAVEQLQSVIAEIPRMDNTKKEALYELGKVYERLGRPDDAQKCYKEIYTVDSRFRDVREIIEGKAAPA